MKRICFALLLLFTTVTAAQAQIVFGVIPLQDSDVMTQKFTPLASYLSEQLGEPVSLKIGSNYDEIESGLVSGDIQVAYVGPSGAVKMNQNNPAVIPLVKVVKGGSPFYKSYVIAKADSSLTSPADLKGKVFAFGDKGSTSSYLVPKYILAKNGVSIDDLKEAVLTGSHSNVLKAVLNGTADAGGLKESLALKNKDTLKFLEISKPIPNFPVCANIKALGKEKAKKLQSILVNMADKSPQITSISKKYDKFSKASISDYQIIAAIMKKQ